MASPPLKIAFEYIAGQFEEGNFEERQAFWDAPDTIKWFETHGYTLYKRLYYDDSPTFKVIPALPVSKIHYVGEYPYACYDVDTRGAKSKFEYLSRIFDNIDITDPTKFPPLSLRAGERQGKVAFAQDSLRRHVAIKLVRADTDEYQILKFLKEQPIVDMRENCILPVLDLLPIEGFYFAVMPRWGEGPTLPFPNLMRQALNVIHSMLKALNFLHKNNIVHSDIKWDNFLVNHFADSDVIIGGDSTRIEQRSKGELLIAIFDFDTSIKLPPDVDRAGYRLPYYRAWGNFDTTMDLSQGEFDYNPFVMDVGAMGVALSNHFRHLTGAIPLLAPLFDKMTTRILDSRFTAAQALTFFEQMKSEIPQADLEKYLPKRNSKVLHIPDDIWDMVPLDFAAKWAHYKEPPLPWTTILLRRIYNTSWGIEYLPRIRLFLFRVSSIPRRLMNILVGGKLRWE